MKKPITIILVGMGPEMLGSTVLAALKKEHGDDLILVSEKDAKDKGIMPEPELKVFPFKEKLKMFIPEVPVFQMGDIKEQHKAECRKGWRNNR